VEVATVEARVPAGIFLADRDRWRDAVDLVHVGLFRAIQELAGVSRERLHIPPLPFGVNGIERQRKSA
jgi:hypothetical protein